MCRRIPRALQITARDRHSATREVSARCRDVIDLGRYGRTLTVLHATQILDEQDWEELEANEDPDADKFNQDGKRIRF